MILWRENSYSSSLTYTTYCKSSQSMHGWQDQNLCSIGLAKNYQRENYNIQQSKSKNAKALMLLAFILVAYSAFSTNL